MSRGDFPRRGRIYTVDLDKPRPALVISIDARNAHASDVLVIPCSTHVTFAPTHVHLRKGDGGLTARSILKCEQITNLPKSALQARPLGPPLNPRVMAEVERCVLRAIGLPVPLD